MAKGSTNQSSGGPKLPDWLKTQKIIEIYTELRLPVCDDQQKIKAQVDAQRPWRLKERGGVDPVVAALATQWFKEVDFLLNKRPAVLERVYVSFSQIIEANIQGFIAAGVKTLTGEMRNSLANLARDQLNLDEDLLNEFLSRSLKEKGLKQGGGLIEPPELSGVKAEVAETSVRIIWINQTDKKCDKVEIVREGELSSAGAKTQDVFSVGGASHEYEDRSVVPGTWYTYRVRSLHQGAKGQSSVVRALCPAEVRNPKTNAQRSKIALTWDMPPSALSVWIFRREGGPPAVSITEDGPESADNGITRQVHAGGGTSWEDMMVKEGIEYNYLIFANYGYGLFSRRGGKATAWIPPRPAPPSNVEAKFDCSDLTDKVEISWSAAVPDFTGAYVVVRTEGDIPAADPKQGRKLTRTGSFRYVDRHVVSGRRYTYTVFSELNGLYSQAGTSADPVDIRSEVRNLGKETGDGVISLIWEPPENVARVIVRRRTGTEPKDDRDGEMVGGVTMNHVTDERVHNDVLYHYRVCSVYKPANSPEVVSRGVTIDAMAGKLPEAAKDLQVHQVGTTVVCTFRPPPHGTVKVFRSAVRPRNMPAGRRLRAAELPKVGSNDRHMPDRASNEVVDRQPTDEKPYYTIVTISGSHAISGGTKKCVVVPDVHSLKFQLGFKKVVLTWEWDQCTAVVVARRSDKWPLGYSDPEAHRQSYTLEQYKNAGERFVDTIESDKPRFYYVVYAQSRSGGPSYALGQSPDCRVLVPWTTRMTLAYRITPSLKSSKRGKFVGLSWTIRDPKPDFAGFVLVANQKRPPEDRQDGEVLYRWTPEQDVEAGEHKTLVSLERIQNEEWDCFYCKVFVARPEQDSSTLIVHPNTCMAFTPEGEADVPDAPPIENRYSPGIPKMLTCPDPECLDHFRTIDMQFSDFKGAKARPGDYNSFDKLWCLLGGCLKQIKPPVAKDGSLMAQKQCRKGHQLAINAGLNGSLIIGMIGAADSGKTHFVTSLVHQLRRQTAEDLKAALMGLTDATNKRYNEELYPTLFGNRMTLAKTIGNAAPLIYDLTMTVRGPQKYENRSVNLTLYDTAGENMKDPDKVRVLAKYLGIASGIVLIVDPLAIQSVRNKLPPKIVEPLGAIDAQNNPTALLAAVLGILQGGRAAVAAKPFSVPLAVAITKCDLLADYGLIEPNRLWSTDRRHIRRFDTQLHEDMAGMWGEFMHKEALGVYTTVCQHFPNHAFFGLSATGCNADEMGRYPFVSPWRVENPLLWLLSKLGVLPVK